jgi:transposase-like protein
MMQRGGQVIIRRLENIRQVTIHPLIQASIAPDTRVLTDEQDLYGRLRAWGYEHQMSSATVFDVSMFTQVDGVSAGPVRNAPPVIMAVGAKCRTNSHD